jgi:diguanylate cyclase (GGDEF)-like protein
MTRSLAASTAIVVAVALFGLFSGDQPGPQVLIVAPIAFFTAALGDAGTAGLLWATWPQSPERRSSFVLVLTFALAAIFTFVSLLVFSTLPGKPPVLAAGPSVGLWVYIVLQLVRCGGAIAYVVVRRWFDGPSMPRSVIIGTVALIIVAVAVLLALAFTSNALPPTVTIASTAPACAAALVGAAMLIAWLPRARPFDRTYALSLLALAIDAVLLAHGPRFSSSYYASHVLLLVAALLVFVASVQSLVRSRATLAADRIRALWRIVSEPTPFEDEHFHHILQTATESLRPRVPLLCSLTHVEEDELVVDATASTLVGAQAARLEGMIRPGVRLPLAGTIGRLVRDAGKTSVWTAADFRNSSTLAETLGYRSVIGAPISVGRRTMFLTFASLADIDRDDPFAEDDIAFVDVIASFIASHFTQQMHFDRIRFQIEHDALTGLENRVQFRRRVREAIARGQPFTVAFVNLDGFRHVNERHGHQIGDEVLVEVAAGLHAIDTTRSVARTSGDEFGIIVPDTATKASAARALHPYAARFRSPFHTGDREGSHLLSISASIGAARFPDDGTTAEALMVRSDAALNAAKQQGGAKTVLFDQRLEATIELDRARSAELEDAIVGGQLALVYQPTFDLASRAIVGAEALVRWDHPTRGRLLPADFISIAERNGLIERLTVWVLERLVADLAGRDLPPGFRISFNVAAALLENFPFISRLGELIERTPHIVQHLGIEVTETAAMQNHDRSMRTIDLLRRWGLAVTIDDFGTGSSSLTYLRALTVDIIKIDSSFVAGLPSDGRDADVTEMLIRIANRFGFTALAEGIETEEQVCWLLERGCRLGQGYLIAHPGSFEQLMRRIADSNAA